MKQRLLSIITLFLLLTACEDTTFRSSVPYWPVGFSINTSTGMYVNFKPTNCGAWLTLKKDGFWMYDGQHLPRTDSDAYGYAGVLVYVSFNEEYTAFDMCCPHCLVQNRPVEIDGCFAVCPICGETYDMSYGYATPMKGISKEALRKYTTIYTGDRLTVRN